MQHPITQRIKILIDFYTKGNKTSFSKMIDQNKQTINRLFKKDSRSDKYPTPSSNILKAICESFPEVNYTWLMTGDGEMFRSETIGIDKPIVSEPLLDYGATKRSGYLSDAEYWKAEYIQIQKKYTALLENKLEELFVMKNAARI